jgi:hypothetical protein
MTMKAVILAACALFASAPASAQPEYQPAYSAKVEADNGTAYAVDLRSARHFGSLVQAGVYDEGRHGIMPMWFNCTYARAGTDPGLMAPVPPRSVGGRLLAVACAEADRHPER